MEFYRFPRTSHLAWLGRQPPRQDKLFSEIERREFLSHRVVVEEKVDGANIGISVDEHGILRAQNRGSYLVLERNHPQFKPLFGWLEQRRQLLIDALGANLLLFGEWCYAVHTIHYTRLPDWFLGFDVYDQAERKFWSTARRDALLTDLRLAIVPRLGTGRFDLPHLQPFLQKSALTNDPPEGIYLRRDEGKYLVNRAKLVRAEFTQAIGEHWSRRPLRVNTRLDKK
jgi:ATP-dependent RNA circularization protein (DNA/RNA ligase family)